MIFLSYFLAKLEYCSKFRIIRKSHKILIYNSKTKKANRARRVVYPLSTIWQKAIDQCEKIIFFSIFSQTDS